MTALGYSRCRNFKKIINKTKISCNVSNNNVNDRFADGTDISWIWDVDFEKLNQISDKLTEIWVTGRRADDMAMRFKYAGIPVNKIKVMKDYEQLIDAATKQQAPVYMMPTYTAMLDIREIFSKNYGFKEFWE